MRNSNEIFKEILKKSKKSNPEIYKSMNVSSPQFSDWKNGRYKPSLEVLYKLSNSADVNLVIYVKRKD